VKALCVSSVAGVRSRSRSSVCYRVGAVHLLLLLFGVLIMEFIEYSVEGLTAYLKTLAANDPVVTVVELLIEEINNQ